MMIGITVFSCSEIFEKLLSQKFCPEEGGDIFSDNTKCSSVCFGDNLRN
jgi:hypothetical protein